MWTSEQRPETESLSAHQTVSSSDVDLKTKDSQSVVQTSPNAYLYRFCFSVIVMCLIDRAVVKVHSM